MPIITFDAELSTTVLTSGTETKARLDASVIQALREGYDHGHRITQRFKDVLKPGHKVDVGTSGKASQNIFLRWQGNDKAGKWEIYEGSARANKIIRTGIAPGRKVSYNVLRKWVMTKGLTLYYKSAPGNTAVIKKQTMKSGFKYNQPWFKKAGTKPKKMMPDSSLVRNAIYAIRYALYKEGTNRPTANWFPLTPSGTGRFDYPAYVLDEDSAFIDSEMKQWGREVAVIFQKHIMS